MENIMCVLLRGQNVFFGKHYGPTARDLRPRDHREYHKGRTRQSIGQGTVMANLLPWYFAFADMYRS